MRVLVCGGAGYIGSHIVYELFERGIDTVVFDSLEKGHAEAVAGKAPLFVGDMRKPSDLARVFEEYRPTAVMDFAAYSLVGESVSAPLKYFENNFSGTVNLLKAMEEYEVRHLVFSSTAAVYGEPERSPIEENAACAPTNPYGESKLCVERMLRWEEGARGLRYAALRYFNAAGAHPGGEIGEWHDPETHLVPLVLRAAKDGSPAAVFGDDYPTPDGTCIRDYIHVSDLAAAHVLALLAIIRDDRSATYNLGNGKGFSVREIIEAARRVTGIDIRTEILPRRAGDPSVLVASDEKIRRELGFAPRFDSLEEIIGTAWNWEKGGRRWGAGRL